MQRKEIQQIVENYLKKKNTIKQTEALRQWLSFLAKKPLPHSQDEQEAIREKMWLHIEEATRTADYEEPKTGNNHISIWSAATAAAASLLLTFGLYHFFQPEHLIYQTGAGETKHITLADGSTIILEENSQMEVGPEFQSDTARTIHLVTGQVFFQVQKDASRPFRIKGPAMQTEVLGTSFRIRSYENESLWHIAVKTGKVAVSSLHNPSKKYTLIAADSLVYSKTDDQVRQFIHPATTSGSLLFHDDNFQNIAQKLKQRYGIAIILEPSLADDHKFSGEFTAQDDMEDILEMICLATGTTYRQENGKIIIQSK
ncbi:FecR family protein [Sphingobacterium chungjuense]|uniref:FecR family protein n=1 Tax=Sphingobacterium chungjuense TaxID=2675553 RepID=UPI00140A33FD|nr:FecR domain-containing protein [Sphingobacterium chungjuense]